MTQLGNPAAFYDALRAHKIMGVTLDQGEFDGLQVLLGAMGTAGWGRRFTAYGLATAYHETAGTMQPVHEYGSKEYLRNNYDVTGRRPAYARNMGNINPGDGVRYAGRGYVQLTWRNNYLHAGTALGRDLVNAPDDAMLPDVAADVMTYGMAGGWFTGKKLSDYITGDRCDFKGARAVINGTDKAALIANNADKFLGCLTAGAWV
jgi:predicted chitinase